MDRRKMLQKEVGTPAPEEMQSAWAHTTFLSSSGVLWNTFYKSKPGDLAVCRCTRHGVQGDV